MLIYALTTNINLAFLTSIGFMVIQWSASKDKAVLLLFTMPRISMSRIIIILSTFLLFFVWGLKIWKNKFIS
ncbi:MAG: hypothetical protein Q4P25_04025 [Tissierellia bacterium]|nr:hypothetical protein [Tissierellia bacterium]